MARRPAHGAARFPAWAKHAPVSIGENARRGLTGPRRHAVDAAGFAVGGALAGVAALRRGKAVHRHGAVYRAQLVVQHHNAPIQSVNTGGGLELTGTLNRLRDVAYPLSQRAWRRAGRAGEQAGADSLLRLGPSSNDETAPAAAAGGCDRAEPAAR